MEATAAEAVERRAPGSLPAPAGGSAPPAARPSPGRGPRRPTAPFGAGFRRGILVSLAIHGALLGGVAWRLLGGPAPAPPPGPLDTVFAPEWVLEEDPPLDTEEPPPPEEPLPPTLLEEVVAEPDAREEPEEEPSPPSTTFPDSRDGGTIGVGLAGSRRAPRPVRRPRGTGAGSPGAAPAAPLLPPPPVPVFVDARPVPGRCAPPRYPRFEERRGIAGTVRLRVAVAADGSVGRVEVETSSGHEALDAAAVAAVERWTFLPATLDGRPADSVVLQPVTFLPPR